MAEGDQNRATAELSVNAARRLSDDEIDIGMLERFVGTYLRAAYEASYADFEALLGDSAVPPGYLSILTLIAHNPGISQTQIGRTAHRDKSAVTKALRRMEDEGLIRRTRLEDDRRTYVSEVTAKGAALQARLQDKALLHVSRITEIIGRERHALLLDTLRELIDNLPGDPR